MNTPDSRRDSETALVDAAVESLGEHFDTVQIFVTRHEPTTEDGTIAFRSGAGNWYARYGQIREWLIMADQQAKNQQNRKDEEP